MVLRLRRGGNWYLDKLKYNLDIMKYLLSIAVITQHIYSITVTKQFIIVMQYLPEYRVIFQFDCLKIIIA
jgi:hypothetical protein